MNEADVELFNHATRQLDNAYAPYSDSPIGAAVRTRGDTIHTGTNVENASFGLTVCAERTAIFKAVSEGDRDLEAVAVAARGELPAPPCGACRQVMREFNPEMRIIYRIDDGGLTVRSLTELLPDSFGPESLD